MLMPTVWDDRYHCSEASPLLSTRKQKQVVDLARKMNLLGLQADSNYDEERTWAQIAQVHSPIYVSAIQNGEPRDLAECQDFSWSPRFADSVARIWSGFIAASRLALDNSFSFCPVSGSHHAGRAKGMALCTFNYLVGAGRVLAEEGRLNRVMIVDLDTHQGNGTWELASEDVRFAHFDISGASFSIPEIDTERLMYKIVRNPEEYFAELSKLSEKVNAFKPDLVLYSAGMDCHQHDDIGGIPGMTANAIARRDRCVFKLARDKRIPMVFCLAGGYQSNGNTVKLHVQTIQVASAVYSDTPATEIHVDRSIDERPKSDRTYRCVLRNRDGEVVLTKEWTGEPPLTLRIPVPLRNEGSVDDSATERRFRRVNYRPRVLLVYFEEDST